MRRELLPPWLLARPDAEQLIEDHGAYFLAAVGFKNNEHLNAFLDTGELTQPATKRRAAARAADLVGHQREVLRKRVSNARRGLTDAERKIAAASAGLAQPFCFSGYRLQQVITTQQARIEERTQALRNAETDLAIFDLLHTEE